MFYEMWLQECKVCYEEKDEFLFNFCKCTSDICKSCYFEVKTNSSTKRYVCVFCRMPEPKTLFANYRPRELNASIFFFFFLENIDVSAQRVDLPQTTISLTASEVRLARKHWHFWFTELRGEQRVRPYIRRNDGGGYMQKVHQLLRTGSFKYMHEAGVCVDKELACVYVTSQYMYFG